MLVISDIAEVRYAVEVMDLLRFDAIAVAEKIIVKTTAIQKLKFIEESLMPNIVKRIPLIM